MGGLDKELEPEPPNGTIRACLDFGDLKTLALVFQLHHKTAQQIVKWIPGVFDLHMDSSF